MTRPGGRTVQAATEKLAEERDFLLASLRDLEREHEAGELADDDYAALRDDYTARAAAVLRQLDQAGRPAKPRSRPAPVPITGSAPDSSQGRLAQALQLETQGKAADALKIYDDLLKTDPKNVQALAYRGWLLKRAGFPDLAMASLDQAVQIDPSYPDAHFFRGMVLYQDRKDPAAAVPEFRAFLSNDPPQEMISLVEGQLKQAMTDAGMPTG
jgi:tetratricopeptide (TPR) repeat protein